MQNKGARGVSKQAKRLRDKENEMGERDKESGGGERLGEKIYTGS